MGCSRFGERWECSTEDLIWEAFHEAAQAADVSPAELKYAWYATALEEQHIGKSGIPLALALRLRHAAVGFCAASGMEALRCASYAVAAGVCDIALALGCEKLKDTGFGGVPQSAAWGLSALYWPALTSPAAFAQLAHAYRARHGVDESLLREAMAYVSVKSHANGVANPKAHLRKTITAEQVLNAPPVAPPIGLLDCCGVSDGAACAIVCSPDAAKRRGITHPVTLKALSYAVSYGEEAQLQGWDGSHLPAVRNCAEKAYRMAGIDEPRSQIDLAQVHDCFSIAELVLLEDLMLCEEGRACQTVLAGRFDNHGAIPSQTDGGLKCFGHPISASGLRMVYELYQQLSLNAGDRQLQRRLRVGLAQSLGGLPHLCASGIAILGVSD